MLGIYKITNTINNKVYIGKSTNIEKRWKYHLEHYTCSKEFNKTLYKALRKYGDKNFTFEVIESMDDLSYDDISNEREKYWIEYYNSYKNGYNETPGGDGGWDAAIKKIKKLTENDVQKIRTLYGECNIGLSEAYELFSDKISKRGFQAVWNGVNYKKIMPEVYSEENKQKHNLLERQRQGRLRTGKEK